MHAVLLYVFYVRRSHPPLTLGGRATLTGVSFCMSDASENYCLLP